MKPPRAKVSMLIRRPASEAFAAFADPKKITQFWLSRTSGLLAPGARVHWDFMVKGASDDVTVTAFEQDRRIAIQWSDGSTTEFRFEPDAHGAVVEIESGGFGGDEDEVIAAALNAVEGFTIVLCDLKTLLEQNVSMALVRDKAALIEAKRSR